MPEVRFRTLAVEPVSFAASPLIALQIAVRTAAPGQRVDSILLRCAVRIEAGRRRHDARERQRLDELFGGESVWARSPKSLLWTNATVVVPGFEDSTTFTLELPCSYDLASAASKYLHGIEGGDVPITVQFSGTLFYPTPEGLQIAQIPWDREAPFDLPVAHFSRVIDAHFPNAAILSLRRDVFERLNRYRREQGLLAWEPAIERLLAHANREDAS